MFDWFAGYEEDKYVKRNFIANVFDGAIFSFAMSFITLSTIMPVFVRKMSGSNIAVGLIPVLWTIGVNFPQVFVANYVRKKHYKKPLLIVTALGQRIPWFLLALISWLIIDKTGKELQLLLFFFFFFVAALASSINLPGWFDLIAKLTPVKLRGRLFAMRSIFGALLGIIGGATAKYVIENYEYPDNFTILLTLTFSIMMVSYIFLFILKEKHPNPPKEVLHYKEFFKRIPLIIKDNKNFRNYIIGDALLISSLMADAFYALNAIKKFSLSDAYAGTFTIIMMFSIIFGNLLFGYIGDKFGHKLNMWIAATSTFLACCLALFSPGYYTYCIVFIFSAFTATLIMVSRLPLIAEICSEEDRPTYIALTNMISSPFILTGLVGGWLANQYGYNIVFILAGLFALLSSVWYFFKVREPRYLSQNISYNK